MDYPSNAEISGHSNKDAKIQGETGRWAMRWMMQAALRGGSSVAADFRKGRVRRWRTGARAARHSWCCAFLPCLAILTWNFFKGGA
jgi:hypothetical protein